MADTTLTTTVPSLTSVDLTTAASEITIPTRASSVLLMGYAANMLYSYDGTTYATVPAEAFAVWQRPAESRGVDPARVYLKMSSGTATVKLDAR